MENERKDKKLKSDNCTDKCTEETLQESDDYINKCIEEEGYFTPDPRRFYMPLTVASVKPSNREFTPEEREYYKKILWSFIDGSRLKENNEK